MVNFWADTSRRRREEGRENAGGSLEENPEILSKLPG